MVLVSPRMCPETTETAPNSPMARALQSKTPYRRPQRILGRVTRQNVCQPRGAERERGFFIVLALRLHHRNEFAGNEGKRDEDGGEHDARHREHDADVVHPQISRRTSHANRTAA